MTTATSPAVDFVYRFVPGAMPGAAPLLLLHGTGGDETDLLPLGQMIAPGAALLSPRGRVLENGVPRFFRRLAEGVFDHEDVVRRAHELADFVADIQARHGLSAPIAVGFSNGANIAAALMLLRPEVLAGAVLIRAMVPLPDPPRADLSGKQVLILSGAMDPIVPEADAVQLAGQLTAAGAGVAHEVLPAGHGLTQADVTLARRWLADLA
ncbi:alpha/beta hydrolase [Phreatobacter sp. HK31-P]